MRKVATSPKPACSLCSAPRGSRRKRSRRSSGRVSRGPGGSGREDGGRGPPAPGKAASGGAGAAGGARLMARSADAVADASPARRGHEAREGGGHVLLVVRVVDEQRLAADHPARDGAHVARVQRVV